VSWLQRISSRLRRHPAPPASLEQVFTEIFETAAWGSEESASGIGSTMEQTEVLREALPGLLRELGVQVFVDVPCGDWHWLRHVDLPVREYIGLDVVPQVVADNVERYGQPGREFRVHDLTRDVPPRADLVLCRDLLVHLSDAEVRAALFNLRQSGSTWLLVTTFTEPRPHTDITTGSWRPLNLQAPPWRWPEPDRLINERCTVDGGKWMDKSLGLWRLADLPLGS
jgi:hypothetical protein